jgi:hypothetical protein
VFLLVFLLYLRMNELKERLWPFCYVSLIKGLTACYVPEGDLLFDHFLFILPNFVSGPLETGSKFNSSTT